MDLTRRRAECCLDVRLRWVIVNPLMQFCAGRVRFVFRLQHWIHPAVVSDRLCTVVECYHLTFQHDSRWRKVFSFIVWQTIIDPIAKSELNYAGEFSESTKSLNYELSQPSAKLIYIVHTSAICGIKIIHYTFLLQSTVVTVAITWIAMSIIVKLRLPLLAAWSDQN